MANKLPPVATLCKSRVRITAMLFVFGIFLAGCQAEIKSVEPTPNPNPKEIYEITVTVENAPGDFTSAEAMVAYAPLPRECLPPPAPFSMTDSSGVTSWKEEKPIIKQMSPTIFVTRVIVDAYVPKNDYGLGLCKWEPQYVDVRLYNGINQHSAGMSLSALQQETAIKEAFEISRFAMKASPESGLKWHTNSGREVTKVNDYPSDKYFYMQISSKKVMP